MERETLHSGPPVRVVPPPQLCPEVRRRREGWRRPARPRLGIRFQLRLGLSAGAGAGVGRGLRTGPAWLGTTGPGAAWWFQASPTVTRILGPGPGPVPGPGRILGSLPASESSVWGFVARGRALNLTRNVTRDMRCHAAYPCPHHPSLEPGTIRNQADSDWGLVPLRLLPGGPVRAQAGAAAAAAAAAALTPTALIMMASPGRPAASDVEVQHVCFRLP